MRRWVQHTPVSDPPPGGTPGSHDTHIPTAPRLQPTLKLSAARSISGAPLCAPTRTPAALRRADYPSCALAASGGGGANLHSARLQPAAVRAGRSRTRHPTERSTSTALRREAGEQQNGAEPRTQRGSAQGGSNRMRSLRCPSLSLVSDENKGGEGVNGCRSQPLCTGRGRPCRFNCSAL